MSAPVRIPFSIATIGLGAALIWMAWEWSPPLLWLTSGAVFRWHNEYVYSTNTAGDSFNVAVNKMFLVGMILSGIAIPFVAFLRWAVDLDTTHKRTVFYILSAGFALFPIGAFGVALVMVSRLTIDMGITPMRLAGVASAIAGIGGLILLLIVLFRLPQKGNA